jgi:hypothetical protein
MKSELLLMQGPGKSTYKFPFSTFRFQQVRSLILVLPRRAIRRQKGESPLTLAEIQAVGLP